MKDNQCTTHGIKHWGLGGYASILPRIKFGVTGQESSPQSPTISYRHPLAETQPENLATNKISLNTLWIFRTILTPQI